MKLTCLSKGDGYYFPPSHILDLAGHRILLECPLDLSPLSAFSPPNLRHPHALLHALPRFRALDSGDPSLLDLVLVSSPPAMLALPFLSRHPRFSARIYATEATARFGRLLMEELLSMHAEYVAGYGPEEEGEVPAWMGPDGVTGLPESLRGVLTGEGGSSSYSSLLPLYSAEDLGECLKKVRVVKYGEHCCHNGCLILKAFSSGLEIGASNWTICCPGRSVTYMSSCIFKSSHAANFDYHDVQGSDVIIFSDFSFLHTMDISAQNGSEYSNSHLTRDAGDNNAEFVDTLVATEYSDEQEKISYICSCIINSVRKGGSVLIPTGRLGGILQLLEQIAQCLELSELKVPIYMISSAAEETLAFVSAMPEWVSKERQEKLYMGEPLFGHTILIEEKKLHVFPALHSSSLISLWHEPCIVFSPHWSLRLGPSVHLLQRWRGHRNCLLILEQAVNVDDVLLPFKPLKLKVLQCSFLSGLMLHKILPLLRMLQPKLVLLPDDLHDLIPSTEAVPFQFVFYTQDCTLAVPRLGEDIEAFLSIDLAVQLQPKRIPEENLAVARLQGQLQLSQGKFAIFPTQKPAKVSHRRVHWGSVDQDRLLLALQEKGINASMHKDDSSNHDSRFSVIIEGPKSGIVQVSEGHTVISAADETFEAEIYEVLCSALYAI